jgi:hypothetical protein
MTDTATTTDAARELALYAANNERAWRAVEHVLRNYERKRAKGTYCPTLARKGMVYPVTMAARDYAREYGAPDDQWFVLFTPADRAQAAAIVMDDAEAEWSAGNFWGEKPCQ